MYEFTLTPAYCLFNGVAVLEQHGSEIVFLVENSDDEVLQGRLKRAFLNYLAGIAEIENSTKILANEPVISFIKGTREQLRRCVSGLFRKNGISESVEKLELEKNQKEAAAVLLLDTLLLDAREKKASDIHIEGNKIRFRIAGRLVTQMELQTEKRNELVQRIKLLSGMNVIERRKNQDGRFIYGKNNPLFIRVSEVIVVGINQDLEESLVLRILDTTRIPLNLNLLGFNENQLHRITEFEFLKNGLILVCGPTGSGKSTTVASILVELERNNKGSLKIISMEDPPEYVIPGVSQIQIDGKNSYNDALAHIFRQDPDVVMIGEIRDEVSALTAIRAALTGHLVFATLHTNGPGESVLRLENLGVERKLLSSVLRGVICQQLSFEKEQTQLCADVAYPKNKFGTSLTGYMCEEEIDELFNHETNYSEVLRKTIAEFNKKLNVEQNNLVSRVDWSTGKDGKRIYKKIV